MEILKIAISASSFGEFEFFDLGGDVYSCCPGNEVEVVGNVIDRSGALFDDDIYSFEDGGFCRGEGMFRGVSDEWVECGVSGVFEDFPDFVIMESEVFADDHERSSSDCVIRMYPIFINGEPAGFTGDGTAGAPAEVRDVIKLFFELFE